VYIVLTSSLTEDRDIINNLREFAARRTDMFGDEEAEVGMSFLSFVHALFFFFFFFFFLFFLFSFFFFFLFSFLFFLFSFLFVFFFDLVFFPFYSDLCSNSDVLSDCVGHKVGEKRSKVEKPIWDGHADSVARITQELQVAPVPSKPTEAPKQYVGPKYAS
jgi:hypothetical protein